MKRVYLDQRFWIELARAAYGRSRDTAAHDTAAIAVEGVRQGWLSFPLSVGHYLETWKQRDHARRRRLGAFMSLLSRHQTIASRRSVVDHELDVTMCATFGRPLAARPLDTFGFGVSHAFGDMRFSAYRSIIEANPVLRAQASEVAHAVERELICGPPFELPAHGIDAPPIGYDSRYADGERRLARRLAESPKDDDLRLRIVASQELLDINERFTVARARAGVADDEFLALDASEAVDFVLRMPWRGSVARLRWIMLADRSYLWRPNDLTDIAYLSLGCAYCDVVAVEGHWGDKMRRARLGELHGTKIVTRLRDLPAALVS